MKPALTSALATALAYVCLTLAPGLVGFLAALLGSVAIAWLVLETTKPTPESRTTLSAVGPHPHGSSLRDSPEARAALGLKTPPAVEAELISNLSHEMRTPLNGILGLTQVLLDRRTGMEQRELLEMIKTSGESILRVLNDLFDYSKIQTGKIQLEPREFRFRRWARQSVAMHAPQAHRKGLEIAYWVEPDVPDLVIGDSQRLRQVLSNLLVNAIKFTEAGEILVEVSRRPSSKGLRLHFSVTDTGGGIPEASRSKIFDAFTQGENVTPEHGGLGLGLAISSAIVASMGSVIRVESAKGKGSRFEFEVPLERAAEADPEPSRTFPGIRALVVDDHPSQREVMARELRALGLEVEAAPSAEAAKQTVETYGSYGRPFTLLFLDSRMPGVDVLALARELTSRSGASSVLLTPSHERLDSEVLRLHGVAGQLTKPVAPSHLVRAIEILSRGDTVEKPEDVQTHGMDRPLLAGLRVLLAEDHPINRTVVVRMLENRGGEVVAVENGREALERWSKERFDILVLDVEMPEVDGLSVAREIRARERDTGGRLPIVALTAHARDEHRERCLAAGMDCFVTKPFEETELVSAMRGALQPEEPKPQADGAAAAVVLDREAARRRANGDPVLLAELAQIFLEETPDSMQKIELALETGDARSVERLAHRLKGALLTLCAPAASSSALELETAAREGRDVDSRRALARLKHEIDRLGEELKQLV